jgi:class 3 adenylate cyclase
LLYVLSLKQTIVGYVAVTGLPKAQSDHAVRMVKFARSCLTKMNQIVQDLKETLGQDTAELEIRIGLHSGPVTAGVLKGEKSRFQLYGETVNTTARMESNGTKGKIHCSKATADQLIAANKKSWLTPRQELVQCKGKGAMQTYYISAASPTSMSVASRPLLGSVLGRYSSRFIEETSDTSGSDIEDERRMASRPNYSKLMS